MLRRFFLALLFLTVAAMGSLALPTQGSSGNIARAANPTINPVDPPGGLTDPWLDHSANCADPTAGCHTEQQQLAAMFTKIFGIITLLAGILAVIYTIYNGIRYITSSGDAAKMKMARANILTIILGIIIVYCAYLIIHFAQIIGLWLSTL